MPHPDRRSGGAHHKPLRFCPRCSVPMFFLGVLPEKESDAWLYYCDCGEQIREMAARPSGLAN
jgi:hypothetical protein